MEKIKCAHTRLEDVHKLVPNPRNPNKHPDEQIQALAKVIDFQGQRAPVVVSNRSKFVIKGHGRLQALKLLGWQRIAVDYQDYASEAEEYADMVADNTLAELSELNLKEVKDFLPELGEDFDLDLLGVPDLKIDPDDVESFDDMYNETEFKEFFDGKTQDSKSFKLTFTKEEFAEFEPKLREYSAKKETEDTKLLFVTAITEALL